MQVDALNMRFRFDSLRSAATFLRSLITLVLDVARRCRLRLGLDEGRRWSTVQHRPDIVQRQRAHGCTGFDRGAADMRQ